MKHYVFPSDDASSAGPAGANAARLRKYTSLDAGDRARWAGLSEQAGPANVFAQHWFMDAALRHSALARDTSLAIVLRGDGTWLGALPLVSEPRFGRWPLRNCQTWLAANQFLGSPLVAPEDAHRFWRSLLRHLDARAGGGKLLHCRQFAWDDPVCRALIECCEAEGRAFRVLDRFERPARFPDSDPAPAGKSEKKAMARLRSLRRRLERDHGAVDVDLSGSCEAWIEAFLALEKSGWKGASGSAMACSPETEGLFREVIRRGHERGQVRLATLTAGGKALAMSSWFETGNRGFGFKMAFDEAFRSYAPGQLLMREVADRIGTNPSMRFDTCTSAPPGKCRSPWGGKRTIYDCAVAIGPPLHRLLFDGLMQARAACATVKPRVKRVMKRDSVG